MKRKTGSDIFITLFCIAGSALCFFFFIRDINYALTRQEQPIGVITFRYNIAQRRFIDRVIWDRLRVNSPLYNGDVIRTADLSEATITFELGDIIDLSANTLIQIFVDSTGSRIDISGGGISVNASSGSSMRITSGSSNLSIERGAVVSVASLSDGAFNVSVNEGAAVLETGNEANETLMLGSGSGLFLNREGQALAIPQAAVISPLPNAHMLSRDPEGLRIEFAWNRINYSSETLTRLEVARDRSFSGILFAEQTSANRFNLVLPEGTWFWRLYPVTQNAQEEIDSSNRAYSRITVIHAPASDLISPVEGQEVSYRTRQPSLRFQWKASPQARSYILEAASSPVMQNPELNLVVSSGGEEIASVVTSALGEGQWYWRVTPVYNREFSGEPAQSNIQSFIVKRETALSPPVLTSPLENAFLNIETGRRDNIFSWRAERDAVSYTIRISADRNMASPVIEENLTETVYRYSADNTSLTPGVWYWTVQQTGSEGDVSPLSPVRSFIAVQGEAIHRQIFPPDNYIIADTFLPDTRFTWKSNLSNIYFQVSNDENFSDLIINEAASLETYTIRSLRSGIYYWRIISSIDSSNNETRQIESSSRRFTIEGLLPSPVLQTPKNYISYQGNTFMIKEGQPLEFSWQPLQGAEYYSFILTGASNPQTPLLERTIYGTSILINMEEYGEGNYNWTVQGFARESSLGTRRTGIPASNSMGIRQLHPVVLEYPQNGRVYSGIEASRRPDTVRWSSRETPGNAVFILARNASMTDVVATSADVSYNVPLPRLRAGNYYWIIRAETRDGYNISAANPMQFRVLPLPLLPAPQVIMPENDYTITHEDLQYSRDVTFTWNSVEDANGYIVTIFVDERAVMETPVLTDTSYAMGIRLLDRGTFSWQVEAVYVTEEDGLIEQRGELVKNRFTIDIPIPQDLRIIESGQLYGR